MRKEIPMKRTLATLVLCTLAFPAFAQDDDAYAHCSITPADAIGPMFETPTAAACEAACVEHSDEGCIAWSYQGPSAMFPDKPGNCRMITAIFKEAEASDRWRCGKL